MLALFHRLVRLFTHVGLRDSTVSSFAMHVATITNRLFKNMIFDKQRPAYGAVIEGEGKFTYLTTRIR